MEEDYDDLFEFLSQRKEDKFEITMFPGRTKSQKANVYREIVKRLGVRLSINESDVFILINEPPNENWGLAGKQREES